VPVLSNGASYNSYQTFGPQAPVPVLPSDLRPSKLAPPPSSDNNHMLISNNNIPNTDIRHFRSPENYLTSGQRPPPNIQFVQVNSNFKPRPSQTSNSAVSTYNLRQYANPHPQHASPIPLSINLQQQPAPNLKVQQQNSANSLLPNLNQNAQYLNPTFSAEQHSPTSFTNFQQKSGSFFNPSNPATFLSPTSQQNTYNKNQVVPRNPSISGINYHNQNSPEEDSSSYLLIEHPNTAVPAVQYAPSTTETTTRVQQSSFQKYVTTLQTLPARQNSLELPHDTLSFDEVHKHQQRETSQHLVPPPPPLQQTEAPQYNKKQEIQETWQKLLREQQQQKDDWSPVPQPTELLRPGYNRHQEVPFSGHAQSQGFENQSSRQQQSQTEGPFWPNTSPYGDSGRLVGVVYKDNGREVSNFYKNLPSAAETSFINQYASDDYLRPRAARPTRHRSTQQSSSSNKNLTEKLQTHTERPKNKAPVIYPPSNTQNNFAAGNDGSLSHAVRPHNVVLEGDTTFTPYYEYESVKLPVQTNNGKPGASDYRDYVYNERKPTNYDEKSYYDDEEVLKDEHPRLERPEPATKSDTKSQHHTRAHSQVETKSKDGRKQPHYEAGHSNEKSPQNQNRQSERQQPSEQTYDGSRDSQKLPQREESAIPNQSGSYNTETFDSDSDQTRTTPYAETTTEDRFPHPPPEFYEEFNKYKDIENPFASFDFDFDEYLDKLRGNPSEVSQQQSSKEEIKNKELPEVTETEGDNNEYTTHQNMDSVTTTDSPVIPQRPRPVETVDIKPERQSQSQESATEYIKEYYPPRGVKHVDNEGTGVHSEEVQNQSRSHKKTATNTGREVEQDSVYEKDHVTTTHTPQPGMATVNHHMNPDPLTVPFYPGDDGNFYANPGHIQPQQHAGESRDVQPPTDTYYKYSVQDDSFDVITSTEKVSNIISTSETYLQPHRDYSNSNSNADSHGLYESTITTSLPGAKHNSNPLHLDPEVVTTPSRGPKPPRRGNVRSRSQASAHDTRRANDNARNNTYFSATEYHQQNMATQPHKQVKEPLATPALPPSHLFNATAYRRNRYQYQEADMPSTDFTRLRPVASLTQSATKRKKMGHLHIQASVEENDTIKPLQDVTNERIPESYKPVTTVIYTSTVPSAGTTEYLYTSSTTQYSDWEPYNSWQGTTPYQKEVSNFELTIPTQPKYKIAGNISGSRLNSELDFTTQTLPEYTSVKFANIHATHGTNTPVTYSGVQTSTRPSNELLESIYDIANTMFKPQHDAESENFEPSSDSANQDPVTKLIRLHPNITTTVTTTIPRTTSLKPRHRLPINQIKRPAIINHVTTYTASSIHHTTPETYTIRHRPSKDHLSVPVRYRIHRPQTMSRPTTTANIIIATALPSNDTDAPFSNGMKSPSPTRSISPVTPRRLRHPTKTRVDMTSTEVYADNDNSESFERPLQDSVNRLNKKPQGNTMTAAPQRYGSK
jgi:hypothetical protein